MSQLTGVGFFATGKANSVCVCVCVSMDNTWDHLMYVHIPDIMLETAFVVMKFLFDLTPSCGFSVCFGTAGLRPSLSEY